MEILNFYKIGLTIPDSAMYIGRYSKKHGLPSSKYANPFPVGEDSREVVVQKYKQWLWSEIKSGRITKDELAELYGKDLVCYCAPQACHGDILKQAILWSKKNL